MPLFHGTVFRQKRYYTTQTMWSRTGSTWCTSRSAPRVRSSKVAHFEMQLKNRCQFFRQKALFATFSLSRTGKAKFISTLPRREKVQEMKPHAKNPPMGSTDVRPIGGLERGAENGAFSQKKITPPDDKYALHR